MTISMHPIAWMFIVFLAGMFWAWYWDNKAFQEYKDEIRDLREKLKRWEHTNEC